MIKFVIFTWLIAAVLSKDYSDYKVYDVTTSTKNQVKLLQKWENEIDVWTHPRVKVAARMMVGPEVEDDFIQFLNENSIHYELTIPNVEVMLRKEKEQHEEHRRLKRSIEVTAIEDATFDHFWTFDEMETYANLLAETYPNFVKLENIGKSIENRNIFALKISNNLSNFGEKPIIFIDAGTHAREWASHACAMYLIHQLATGEFSVEMLEKVDWVVIPNVNPDGYAYTHEIDRLWRKNRRVVNSTCTGVDLNRNYPYEWQQVPESCDTIHYAGASPLSEPETSAVATYMQSFSHNLKLYVATHAYGPFMLWPWGFDLNVPIANWKEHQYLGDLFVDAVRDAGNEDEWIVGNSADVLYLAVGASDDFAVSHCRAKLAFTLELPPRPTNDRDGMEYPQEMIERLVGEIFMGYRATGRYVGETYYRGGKLSSLK